MGKVNDFYVYQAEKLQSLSEIIPQYEWENETTIPNFTVTYEEGGRKEEDSTLPDTLPELDRRVLWSVVAEASLYQLGISRFKYIDYLHCEVTNYEDKVVVSATASNEYDSEYFETTYEVNKTPFTPDIEV